MGRRVHNPLILLVAQATLFTGMLCGQSAGDSATGAPSPLSLNAAIPSGAELKPAPPTPIAEKKEELGQPSWDPTWDAVIEKALPDEFLTSKKVARDVKTFCPRYASMSNANKRAYWAYFFQALAGAEAGLDPKVTVRHTQPEVAVKDTVTKKLVRQEGLLQLTYMDAERYGCDFDWEKDKELSVKDPAKTILQPENNLLCGIRILTNQLITRKKPLLIRTSYWATLRPGTYSYSQFRKQMTNVPGACRAPERFGEAQAITRPAETSDNGSRAVMSAFR